MNITTVLDDYINEKIVEKDKEKREAHVSSGKLSASILGWTLQWQVLKYLGVPQSKVDDYTLRKFLRGNHVEDFIASQLDGAKSQVEVSYRDCVGYIDLLWNDNIHEIKSVANSKYRWITKKGKADPQHVLQGALYALGHGSPTFTIDYVASDDYRITSFEYMTFDYKSEVDTIIDEYNKAIETRTIPMFSVRYDWQNNQKYSPYPEFMTENKTVINNLLKKHNVSW